MMMELETKGQVKAFVTLSRDTRACIVIKHTLTQYANVRRRAQKVVRYNSHVQLCSRYFEK